MLNDCKSRYLNDPIFHTVVDHIRAIIRSATLTPSEVREAAMTACVIEEMYNPRPPFTTDGEDLERVRQALARTPAARQAAPGSHADGGEGIPNP